MAEVTERCAVCLAMLDEEDVFCANCGTEAPHAPADGPASESTWTTHKFQCQGCGASMSYDASAQTLRCPFCGSERMSEQDAGRTLAPKRVLPFAVDRQQALQLLRRWMGSSFWRPRDLAQASVVNKMTPVYVPYWVFEAACFTYWNADSSRTPAGARADWYPVHGEHRARYRGVLVGASGALSPNETAALCPFDLGRAVPPDQVDLDNVVYEPFTVQRKYARPLARDYLEAFEYQACEKLVPGKARNLKLNMRLEAITSEPVLLPVWIMAYRYREQTYRVLINGQSGKLSGQAPFDWKKLWIILGSVALIGLIAAAIAIAASQ